MNHLAGRGGAPRNRIIRRITYPLLLLIAFTLILPLKAATEFQSARPVWPAGRSTELNLLVEFHAAFAQADQGHAILRVTGATEYRIQVNGQFAGFGPARAGHGFPRPSKSRPRNDGPVCAVG